MKDLENQSLRDLIFNPLLYSEYPYRYEDKNEDGTTTITFSKVPILKPSLEDEINYKKFINDDYKNVILKEKYK